jgi:hypothetical protein
MSTGKVKAFSVESVAGFKKLQTRVPTRLGGAAFSMQCLKVFEHSLNVFASSLAWS